MESIKTIFDRMLTKGAEPAIYWQDKIYSYDDLGQNICAWKARLKDIGVVQGSVCGFLGEYSPEICALIFALMDAKAILVPFTPAIENELQGFVAISGVEYLFHFDASDCWTLEKIDAPQKNDLIVSFLDRGVPGLVVFSSGSTGKPKGILQDCERVMRKFVEVRAGWRTVLFLMLDHFGGFNTLLSTFAYGGMAICLPDRNPESVCRVIQQSDATLLPTTPTFINLLLASRSYKQYNLSSVKLITYGTEVMPDTTLQLLKEIFPSSQIKQTYGLSELGVLRSKSEGDNSVWVKVGGDGFETKIVDNLLWIRSEANMVGYLNAPSPFDSEGWMCTGDHVEVRGDYIRILGRKSEMINVGGQKVFPAEVESVLLQDSNVREATAYGVKHPLMGEVVNAKISLFRTEEYEPLIERLRKLCFANLTKYKIPVRFQVVGEDAQRSARYKKNRLNLDKA